MSKKQHAYGIQGINLGSNYTEDELEFILAMERFRHKTGIKFPTCCDVLRVAKSLGYRKVSDNARPSK